MKPYRELWWPRFWPFLRVVDFYWFHCYRGNYWSPGWWQHKRYKRFKQAAAHLASAECQSRAHEIRAKLHGLGVNFEGSQRTAEFWAREYAITIYRASNYPYIRAAGWTEEDCYNEIIKHL